MRNNQLICRAVTLFLTAFLSLALMKPLLAQQVSGTTAPLIKLSPAEITTAATQAMMLSAVRAGKRIVAVGDHGIVLLSDDNGASFRQAKSVPARATLTAVSFVDDKHGWAVGHWGLILRTDDGGETWRLQRSDTVVDQPLFSVYFKDSNVGWATGLWSLALTTRDGGQTWDSIKMPAPPKGGKADRNLLKIFANSKGTLFVVSEQGTVLRSEDSGATWTYLETGYQGSFWTGITLKDGSILVGGLRGTIYRSSDDGKSWQISRSSATSSITDIAESNGTILAVGLDGIVLKSSDNGASFTATHREDRLSLTALVIAGTGQPVIFSKRGVVTVNRDK